jgi:phosphoribosylformimino-5-aminoimidazole carboxamide ribotide isomerase
MVGTAALAPGFVEIAVERFGDQLVVAVDVRDGKAAVDGWMRVTETSPAELARRCSEAGVSRLLVTSTTRDGSLVGPDLDLLAGILPIGLPVVAAGGISSVADLVSLQQLGCEAAVAGSALLSGRFTLAAAREALDAAPPSR